MHSASHERACNIEHSNLLWILRLLILKILLLRWLFITTYKGAPHCRLTVFVRAPQTYIIWVKSILYKSIGIWLYNMPVCIWRELNRWPLGLQITIQRLYHSDIQLLLLFINVGTPFRVQLLQFNTFFWWSLSAVPASYLYF